MRQEHQSTLIHFENVVPFCASSCNRARNRSPVELANKHPNAIWQWTTPTPAISAASTIELTPTSAISAASARLQASSSQAAYSCAPKLKVFPQCCKSCACSAPVLGRYNQCSQTSCLAGCCSSDGFCAPWLTPTPGDDNNTAFKWQVSHRKGSLYDHIGDILERPMHGPNHHHNPEHTAALLRSDCFLHFACFVQATYYEVIGHPTDHACALHFAQLDPIAQASCLAPRLGLASFPHRRGRLAPRLGIDVAVLVDAAGVL